MKRKKAARRVKNLKAALKVLGKKLEEGTDEQTRKWGYELSTANRDDSLAIYLYYFPRESEGRPDGGTASVYAFPDFRRRGVR
jgi:hypothetical protein